MTQATTVTRPVDTHTQTATETTNLSKAITAFAFRDLTVRHCGHGLPSSLPFRQDDWTLDEVLKSRFHQDSITDREVLFRLGILDEIGIEYDHIYLGHQDKKPFKIPQKVIDTVSDAFPVLAKATLAILTCLVAGVAFVVDAALLLVADPIVVVAIREENGSYELLEIGKWYD